MEIKVAPVGDHVVVREGRAPEIFIYKGVSYQAHSTDSLVALVKAKSVKENCIIAYNQKGFEAILNDEVHHRQQDRVSYSFKTSIQYREWEDVLTGGGQVFNQKQFIDFLRRREREEIIDVESLIAAVQNFKYVTSISGDFTYDDRNNYTFSIKVGDAEGTVRLPQMITVNIEIYNESGYVQPMEIEIEVQKPKSEGEKPLFLLHCPKMERYMQKAMDNEIESVKAELSDYLIVAGSI